MVTRPEVKNSLRCVVQGRTLCEAVNVDAGRPARQRCSGPGVTELEL